jgi:hypothetical protein
MRVASGMRRRAGGPTSALDLPATHWKRTPEGSIALQRLDGNSGCISTGCARLTELSGEQATYIGVRTHGPFKSEHYR